jgi:hypothetical protein
VKSSPFNRGVAGHGIAIAIGLQSRRDRHALLGEGLEHIGEAVVKPMIVLIQERGRPVAIAADVVEHQGPKPPAQAQAQERGDLGHSLQARMFAILDAARALIVTNGDSSAPAIGDAASIAAIAARKPSASSPRIHAPCSRPRL